MSFVTFPTLMFNTTLSYVHTTRKVEKYVVNCIVEYDESGVLDDTARDIPHVHLY